MNNRLKPVFLATLMAAALTVTSCANWSENNKRLFGVYLTFNAIDAWQTGQGAKRGAKEINPLARGKDGAPDMQRVYLLKIVGTALIGVLLNQAPGEKERTGLLYFANSVQGGVVLWNYYVLSYSKLAEDSPFSQIECIDGVFATNPFIFTDSCDKTNCWTIGQESHKGLLSLPLLCKYDCIIDFGAKPINKL